VLAPPGGASSGIFGNGQNQPSSYANTQAGQTAMRAAKSDIFGAGPPQQKANYANNATGATAARSAQSNIFGAPTDNMVQQTQQPKGGRMQHHQGQVQQQDGQTAGGGASQQNMGGYGSYDINKPSSRVLAPPGGGSSITFG
jgi:hypothetical protein